MPAAAAAAPGIAHLSRAASSCGTPRTILSRRAIGAQARGCWAPRYTRGAGGEGHDAALWLHDMSMEHSKLRIVCLLRACGCCPASVLHAACTAKPCAQKHANSATCADSQKLVIVRSFMLELSALCTLHRKPSQLDRTPHHHHDHSSANGLARIVGVWIPPTSLRGRLT
jgi:hypothetical protein